MGTCGLHGCPAYGESSGEASSIHCRNVGLYVNPVGQSGFASTGSFGGGVGSESGGVGNTGSGTGGGVGINFGSTRNPTEASNPCTSVASITYSPGRRSSGTRTCFVKEPELSV